MWPEMLLDGELDEDMFDASMDNFPDNETDRVQHERRLGEVQRRRFEKVEVFGPQKKMFFIRRMLTAFSQALPVQNRPQFAHVIRQYLSGVLASPEALAENIKQLVDDHGIIVQLDYTEHRGAALESAGIKRALERDKTQRSQQREAGGAPDAAPPVKSKKKTSKSSLSQGQGGHHGPGPDEKDLSDLELTQFSSQLARNAGRPGGPGGPGGSGVGGMITCADLKDTSLGIYLTSKARGICARDLVIKVVADVPKQANVGKGAGGRAGSNATEPTPGQDGCRRKAIFAFQRVDDGEHFVLCFGMYVHEYGPGGSQQHIGRIYVECVDSVPLYGLERGEERQALLSGIVLSYFDYARSMGFRYAHVHVPPPTDENSHIFASRSLVVRLRASLHLAYWYKRLLVTARQNNIIMGYEVGQTGNMPNFPLSMLSPSELTAELAFRNADPRVLDQQTQRLMERVSQLQDRFFVICLQPTNSSIQLTPDTSPILPSSVAADRGEFVG
ncbi:hypothetical protein T484DRAFT_2025276, partial [Baffinella frigidus]